MIYFSGGEPLMHPEHYEMLEYLVEIGNKDIILKYNSNGSILNFKGKNVIDLWKNFKNVEYYISIDGIEEREEYIRHGADWKIQVENIKRIQREVPHVKLNFNTVISIFNVLTITELFDMMIKLKMIDINGIITPSLDILTVPTYFSITLLDSESKKIARNKINIWLEKNLKFFQKNQSFLQQVNSILKHLENEKENVNELREELKIELDKIDSRRNENFVKTFPELEKFYQLCSNE